jgi:hypothetical protein
MDIHKPKPWHGLREFWKELGTIVLGVLIALGAEQTVEWLHREAEVREAREALRVEITQDLTIIRSNTKQDVCMGQYLQRLTEWAQGGLRPGYANIVFEGLGATVWDIAKTGAVPHMPLADRLAYASFYGDAALYQTLVERERTEVTEIFSYYRMGPLTPEEGRRLRLAVNGYEGLLRVKVAQEAGFVRRGARLGLKAEPVRASTQTLIDQLCAIAKPAGG